MTPPKSTNSGYSEDALVERPAIELFGSLGWETANVYQETFGADGTLGRETDQEVVLVRRLRASLRRLNADLPADAIDAAIEEITRDRSVMSQENANREVYHLLKDGVKVTIRQEDGGETPETVRVIDWRNPKSNDFFLASQFWVSGDMYRRRCDLVGFVNGIPMIFIELKASHRRLEGAFTGNLRDYKSAIPKLFWFNEFIILSNGTASRIGSTTATWEHFAEWKRINDEGEAGRVSLETMVQGTCEPGRLLDIVENFVVFEESGTALVKKVGMNHQYLGVNRAIHAVQQLKNNQGRLGVFWHTQGSGKSVSMVFLAQKILRTIPGNWTFVIVTDRQELDDQIYKHFVACGAITEKQAQAINGDDLRRLLREDHRYVFTLIQKFRSEKGKPYPVLSDRSDVIVIADEAHRTQYDAFALNMRHALPKAAFIGFTGTPLMAGEEKTREVFGDYVSVYNFRQSLDDHATVPLYYENRIPELQLTNENLNADMERLLEEAELDDDQERKLEREFAREYHLVTREDRPETIAKDVVTHFMGRGYRGKAMVVAIDKATAVRMYDKVTKYWQEYLEGLRREVESAALQERGQLDEKIAYMAGTDMAVVVSQSQNEIEEMRKRGLDIAPHRRRMVKEELAEKFKDSDDPLRIVFVCAMWMTGFDVPSCSTIYLDKPMRNHTLMQTIARANRVFKDKVSGLIVDYVGVFRNLQKALAIYATRQGDAADDSPIMDKAALIAHLRQAVAEAETYSRERGVELAAIQEASGFDRVRLLDDAVEAIIVNDEGKRKFLQLAGTVVRLYKAILPDPSAGEFSQTAVLLGVIGEKIRALAPPPDISDVMGEVGKLLDESIETEQYIIPGAGAGSAAPQPTDLAKIDFGKLQAKFETARKRTEVEKLRGAISQKLGEMVKFNRMRADYLQRFQELIEEYNAGSLNTEQFFDELLKFAKSLNEEEKRGIAEKLTEEELALFDVLTKPEPALTKKEEAEVKNVARTLLEALKREKLVLDWRKRQQARQAVRLTIEEVLEKLPPVYPDELYRSKCDLTYRHVYDSYFGEGKSIYATGAAA